MSIKTRNTYGLITYKNGEWPPTPYVNTGEWISGTTSRRNRRGGYTQDLPVTHIKLLSVCDFLSHFYIGTPYASWTRTTGSYLHIVYAELEQLIGEALNRTYIQLDFQENDDFEILNFIAEFDEVIALFSKSLVQFLRNLTYGEVTWSIAPLISDLRAIVSSATDIHHGILDQVKKVAGKRVTRRCPFAFVIDRGTGFRLNASGVTTMQGFIDCSTFIPDGPLENLLTFFDEIGLHPDAKTIWDLTPFSFVVDYFLPIGDLLESLHPRGWFNPTVSISGTYSVKMKVTLEGTGSSFEGSGGTYSVYRRVPSGLSVPSRPPIIPQLEMPSIRQLFNTWYLAHKA